MTTSEYSYIFVDRIHHEIHARVSCKTSSKGKWHFAECPELDLMDQGLSKIEAIENLKNMVGAVLSESVETENLDGMLRELGFKISKMPVPNLEIFQMSNEPFRNMFPLPIETRFAPRGFISKSLLASV